MPAKKKRCYREDEECGHEPDPTRCMAWSRKSFDRCALDVGHYKDRLTNSPSPHISENGEEWY